MSAADTSRLQHSRTLTKPFLCALSPSSEAGTVQVGDRARSHHFLFLQVCQALLQIVHIGEVDVRLQSHNFYKRVNASLTVVRCIAVDSASV